MAPKTCFPIPDDVDTKTAAAIFVNYLTAYFAIFHSGSVKPNDDVFIDSCGGGVGWAATQLAKTIPGVRVNELAECSKNSEHACTLLGLWDNFELERKRCEREWRVRGDSQEQFC